MVEVSFELSSYSVTEGETETVKVKLDADPERTVIITLIPANQGGASDSDYSGVPANVTFGPTETEQTFTFTAAQDSVDDDGESVKLTFGSQLPAGVSRGSVPETTVSINDDDDPVVEVSFELSSYSVTEGETETVKVKLDADPERTVIITLIPANQGGASDSDYSGVRQRHLRSHGDGADLHLHRGPGQRGRRRRERQAHLRQPIARGGV